ncbi:MAG: prephenate dehydrogenase/arogenate dehydrogenase family protein, partial [Thermostichales cyanobacterium BF4_bins_65]
GIRAAQRGLFQGAVYALTPLPQTQTLGLQRLEKLIRDLGAEALICDPDEHDQAVAAISHLPVWVSAALIATASQQGSLAWRLASSGFRDTSRVGGGNPQLGVGMAQANQQALLGQLQRYQAHLAQIQTWIEQGNWDCLRALLEQTQRQRQQFRGCRSS